MTEFRVRHRVCVGFRVRDLGFRIRVLLLCFHIL